MASVPPINDQEYCRDCKIRLARDPGRTRGGVRQSAYGCLKSPQIS